MKSSFAKILSFGSFEDFALREFKAGIALKFADIIKGKYFLYLRSPQNALFPCVLYNSLLSSANYRAKQKPILHFSHCEFLAQILRLPSTKAKLMKENAFDYAVGNSAHLSGKLFFDIELPFCAKCIEHYNAIFGAFDGANMWDKMFKNELFCAIEMDALKIEGMETKMAKNHFYLAHKREV